jgi:hypothetical protein
MCAAITSAAIGAGVAAYTVYNAEEQKKKAKKELNNYEREELNNAFENVQISTMGSDLLREENARTTANLVDATQTAGARTVIGAIPRVVGASNEINREAAKMLDDQVQRREYAIAGDNARVENIRENRDNANISALSSQIDAANQDSMNGIMGFASSVGSIGRSIGRNNANVIQPTQNENTFVNPNMNFSESINYTPSFRTPMSKPYF